MAHEVTELMTETPFDDDFSFMKDEEDEEVGRTLDGKTYEGKPEKPQERHHDILDAEIEKAFLQLHDFHSVPQLEFPDSRSSTPTVFDRSEQYHSTSSVTSEELDTDKLYTEKLHKSNIHSSEKPQPLQPQSIQPNLETVTLLKKSMGDHSRLLGVFEVLKTTYMNLCKEFNYLLGKFNDNERVKINLIHENNQLRQLLIDTIKEKELDRQRYQNELAALRARS